MTKKYAIKFDEYDDYSIFPLGVEESEYGAYDTYEEALADAIKSLNETKEHVEKLLKNLQGV